MFEIWDNVIINKIVLAAYIPVGTGTVIHNNRPSHGFVINDENGIKDYIFSDGTILHTHENEVFYLPKGSSYHVVSKAKGNCYAINFDVVGEIHCKPFALKFRNSEAVMKCFKAAAKDFLHQSVFHNTSVLKNLYEIIHLMGKEFHFTYMPSEKEKIIAVAVEKIHQDFCRNDLTISELAAISDVSETYFRRLFTAKYGISPKEYIIKLRINHAKKLLMSGDFTVNETAELCGYCEPCHFSREFSKHTGISPKNYRYQ